jgi:hypothetical protein
VWSFKSRHETVWSIKKYYQEQHECYNKIKIIKHYCYILNKLQVSLVQLWTHPSRTNPFPQRQYMFQLDDLLPPPPPSLPMSSLLFPLLRLIRPVYFLPPILLLSQSMKLIFSFDFLWPFRFFSPMSCRFLNILDHVSSYIQRFLLRWRKTNFSPNTQLRQFYRMIYTSSLGRTAIWRDVRIQWRTI